MNKIKELRVFQRLPVARVLAVLVLGLSLGSCSWLPDWLNPMNAYDNVFGSSTPPAPKKATEAERRQLARQDAKTTPSLASVPDKAPATSSPPDRRQLAQGLVSDRQNARYSDENTGAEAASPKPPTLPQAPVPRQVAPGTPVAGTTAAPPVPTAPASTNIPRPPAAASELPIAPGAPRGVAPTQPSAIASTQPTPGAPPFPTTVLPRGAQPLQAPAAGPVPAPPNVVQPRPVGPSLAAAAPTPATLLAAAPSTVNIPGAVQLGGYTTTGTNVAQVFSEKMAQSSATVTTLTTHIGYQPGITPGASASMAMAPSAPVLPSGSAASPRASPSLSPPTVATGGAVARAGQLRVPVRGATAATNDRATVKFEHGSVQITEDARTKLRALAVEQRATGGVIRVIGHASSRTRNLPVDKHQLANFNVSLDRALAVARELMRLGVSAKNIAIEARGDADPLYYESMPAGEAENRRVEVILGL